MEGFTCRADRLVAVCQGVNSNRESAPIRTCFTSRRSLKKAISIIAVGREFDN